MTASPTSGRAHLEAPPDDGVLPGGTPAPSRPRVLLVGDGDGAISRADRALRTAGAEVLAAVGSRAALDLSSSRELAVAVIVMEKPDDRYRTAEQLRAAERTRDVPLVFVTAGPHDPRAPFRGHDAGALFFVFASAPPQVLAQTVTAAAGLPRHVPRRPSSAEAAWARPTAPARVPSAPARAAREPLAAVPPPPLPSAPARPRELHAVPALPPPLPSTPPLPSMPARTPRELHAVAAPPLANPPAPAPARAAGTPRPAAAPPPRRGGPADPDAWIDQFIDGLAQDLAAPPRRAAVGARAGR